MYASGQPVEEKQLLYMLRFLEDYVNYDEDVSRDGRSGQSKNQANIRRRDVYHGDSMSPLAFILVTA